MKVVVTGNRGYIGAVMVPMLQAAGHEVTGFDTDLYGECNFLPFKQDIPQIKKDLRDVEPSDLKGFDAVIHLAALSNDPLGNLNRQLTYDINLHASVRMADAAKRAGVGRYIFSSSCSNYGAAGDGLMNETSQLNPVTAYGESKVAVEKEVAPLGDANFCPIFLRSATAYGASPMLRFDLVLNNLVAWAVTSGKVHIKSDGTPWRPIVHIEDISRAFLAMLKAPRDKVFNQAFNVGRTTENYRVSEIADIVKETVPNCQIEYATDASPDTRNYRADFTKIATVVPEFQPVWTARKGAQQMYELFKEAKLTVDDFEGPRYKRIDHIKKLLSSGRLSSELRWA
jgi:nucleoside-diphosphate-sugar epimerase